MQSQSISFREIRNVPEVLNAAFDVIRLNFRQFRKGLLLYVLPSLFIAHFLFQFIASGVWLDSMERLSRAGSVFGFDDESISTGDPTLDGLLTLASVVLYLVGMTLLIAFTHAFALVYRNRESHSDELDLADLWEETKYLFWKVLGTNIGLGIVAFIGLLVISFIVGIFGLISPILGGLGVFGILLMFPIVIVTYSLYYPVRFVEGQGFIASFGRAWKLISGSWWRTCGLLIVCLGIVSALSFVSSLPALALRLLATLNVIDEYDLIDPYSTWSLVSSALTAVAGIAVQLLIAFPLLSLIFHYYSQLERQDSPALNEEVERIGMGDGIV